MAQPRPKLPEAAVRRMSGLLFFGAIGSLFGALSACDKKSGDGPAYSALSARGRVVYQTTCTACHNADPHKPGTLGPEVHGASLELLEARILKAAYPDGYKAKRETHLMVALPQLKDDIPAIKAYLSE
jgi:mono/diheme cytochrome c family protein